MARSKRKKSRRRSTPPTRKSGGPWLSTSAGLRGMLVLSLVLAGFIVWQLYPSEGLLRSLLWGLGFGIAIWAVFYLSFAFNTWVRRRD